MKHLLRLEDETATDKLLVCGQCDRRVVLRDGELIVLDKGDFFAFHSYGNGIEITADVR